MFALSDGDLQRHILGCADGPASFNAEATLRGATVVSTDPLYRFDTSAIRERIDATYAQVIDQTRRNAGELVWDAIRSVDELGAVRMEAMTTFLADSEAGTRQGRYIDAELPALPFSGGAFDLAVGSHFLFLYTDHLSESFHELAITEMCRVAREVRVFPLLALGAQPSPHVEPVSKFLRDHGLNVTIETVPYEFQRGGNQMMRVRAAIAS